MSMLVDSKKSLKCLSVAEWLLLGLIKGGALGSDVFSPSSCLTWPDVGQAYAGVLCQLKLEFSGWEA